ncbi:MAG: hypothetical protein Q4A67_07125 [Aerococcus sp.]|nr:hypothetical protein [Aerococcus sp.]
MKPKWARVQGAGVNINRSKILRAMGSHRLFITYEYIALGKRMSSPVTNDKK